VAGFVTELPVSLNRAAFAGIGFTQTDTTNTSNSAATVPVTKPVEATAQPAVLTHALIAPARELFWAQADKLDLRPDFLGQSSLPF
jgi:hypothetical protein